MPSELITHGFDTAPLRAREGVLRLASCAAQGTDSQDARRLAALLECFDTVAISFDKSAKFRSFRYCLSAIHANRTDLLVIEGTGLALGVAALIARLLFGQRYVISSGDAVAPYLAARFPPFWPLFQLYERLLVANCSGYIGWTPYLVGRALTFGARRAITVPGWAADHPTPRALAAMRRAIREKFAIPPDALVFGIAGSLNWSRRRRYCYGLELVRATALSRAKPYILIVGGGGGLDALKTLAGEAAGQTILFAGQVPRESVIAHLAAMDVASLPQSVDGVGSFRYATKLADYKAAGLHIVSNQIPAAYDLDDGDITRLPGDAPWSHRFVMALSGFMDRLAAAPDGIRHPAAAHPATFDKARQIRRVSQFLLDIAAADEGARPA